MQAWTRKTLRNAVLRGPVLEKWVARRGRQWDQAYRAQLAQTFFKPLKSEVPPAITASGKLRQILLIADCMWEHDNLVPEFKRIADTRLLDLNPALKKKRANQSLAEVTVQTIRSFVETEPRLFPDVILFYARPLLLSEEVFHVLRQRWKCPLLGMNLDDKSQFFPYGIFASGDDNYVRWAGKFDLNITNCLPATEWYRQHGLPCIYSPSGMHRTANLTEPSSANFKHEFSFLGSIKPERKVIIEEIQHAGVPIQLFGAGWPKSQWVDNPNTIFRSTQINLGIGFASPSLTLTTVKGRDFECPGAGACYLTTYNWELPLHYELGKEILCYRSIEELLEIYAYYRKRPSECLKIAQAAWRRCAAEHTWEIRFRKIFRHVGFKV